MDCNINDNAVVNIQYWMVKDLKLTGVDLLAYALIFTHTQGSQNGYSLGSEGIMRWCGCSQKSAVNSCKKLLDMGLISLNEKNGLKYILATDSGTRKVLKDEEKTEHITDANAQVARKVLEYLNKKTGRNYRSTVAKTRSLINARLKEGFKEQDFYDVIDRKVYEWGDNEKMSIYLRPTTLFGTKFEAYLQSTLPVYNEVEVEEEEEVEMTDEEWLEMMRSKDDEV